MMSALLLGLFAAAQSLPEGIIARDPPQGPMPGENRTLSQWHPGMDDRMFPDLAVKGLRIDGDMLYVQVVNLGRARANGPIWVAASAQADGIRGEAQPARMGKLMGGESRWVRVGQFSLKSASRTASGPIFVLESADLVSANIKQAAPAMRTLDRTGQGCDRCHEVDTSNNSLSMTGAAIGRGRPE
jgi:hypothetical protein